jgi:hypothetical protein
LQVDKVVKESGFDGQLEEDDFLLCDYPVYICGAAI